MRLKIEVTIDIDEKEWEWGKEVQGEDWDMGTQNEAFVVATFSVRDAIQAYAPSAHIGGKVIK